MAIGLASNLSPMYIAEISPAAVRGKLVSLNQLTIVIGILLAQFVNWLIAQPVPTGASAMEILNSWNGQIAWRWMFGVTALPSLLFLLGMLIVPESPRWLARNGRHDKAERSKLMVFGSAALALIYCLLGFGFYRHSRGIHMLLLVVAAIACYAMSLAPVTWVVISEVFPNRIRGTAMSVAVTSLWIASFILTYTFPLLNRGVGPAGTFWIYAGICLAGFLFIRWRLPETKSQTLDESEDALAS